MRPIRRAIVGATLVAMMGICSSTALARQPKKYQVTGKVLEVTKDYIAVDKQGERWEVGRDAATKITGSLQVGARVTVEYQMTATHVDVKAAAAAAADAK